MSEESKPGEITALLVSWSGGDGRALENLTPLVYRELRRIAAAYLRRERRDHTLQPTALVHEAYLRLIDQSIADCHSRAQFFAIAAKLMRQILVDHARRNRRIKRGGANKVALDDAGDVRQQEPQVDLLALNEALEKLTELDPRQGRIVELRFFGGLTEEEIAEILNVSTITVKRDWRIAKAALHHHLGQG